MLIHDLVMLYQTTDDAFNAVLHRGNSLLDSRAEFARTHFTELSDADWAEHLNANGVNFDAVMNDMRAVRLFNWLPSQASCAIAGAKPTASWLYLLCNFDRATLSLFSVLDWQELLTYSTSQMVSLASKKANDVINALTRSRRAKHNRAEVCYG